MSSMKIDTLATRPMHFQNDTRCNIDDEALFSWVATLTESDNESVEMRNARDIGIFYRETLNMLDSHVRVIRGSFARVPVRFYRAGRDDDSNLNIICHVEYCIIYKKAAMQAMLSGIIELFNFESGIVRLLNFVNMVAT